jgi:acyl carrier protein
MVAGKPEAEANRLISALVAGEVAQILLLAAGDIDLQAPIDSLGMDSLMALELRMSLEAKYGIELPVMAISAVGNLSELACRILKIVRGCAEADEAPRQTDTERALVAIHGGEAAEAAIQRIHKPTRRIGAGH